jgi:membrane associated rhomboid family serine protease
MSLGEAARDRRIVLSTIGWVILNIAFGYGAAALTSAGGIAWEAHLGGYFAGLLLFGLFDPGRSRPYDELDYFTEPD